MKETVLFSTCLGYQTYVASTTSILTKKFIDIFFLIWCQYFACPWLSKDDDCSFQSSGTLTHRNKHFRISVQGGIRGSGQFSSIRCFNKANPSTSLANLCLVIFVCTPPTFHKTFLHANVSVAFTDWAEKFHKMTRLYLLRTSPLFSRAKKNHREVKKQFGQTE